MQMAAPAVFFPLSWILMLGLGGGVGVPLGVPPLPEDPLLARMAPEQCVFYLSWAGTATPDPKSTNQTEQLLAEPEVQQLIAQIERQIMAAVRQAGEREGPEAAALAQEAAGWVKTLLTRPTAIFLSSVAIKPAGPDVRGGALVCVGEDAAKLKGSLEKYQQMALGWAAQPVQIDGATWYRIQPGPNAPAITWGVKGKYLIVGVGEGEVENMLKRARGTVPAWLSGLNKQLPVDRVSMVTYVNVKTLVDTFLPMAPPQARTAIDAVGLGNVTMLAGVSGFDKEGFVSKTLIGLDGQPQGLLTILAGKPLGAADLAPIPRDSTWALAARLDADNAFETFLSTVEKIEPRGRQEITRDLAQMENELGFTLRDDLLKTLGDAWCVYSSPSESGLVPIGVTAVVQVKDRQRLAATLGKLVAAVKAAEPKQPKETPGRPFRPRPFPRIEQFQFAGQDVFVFNAREDDFPLAPAWCLTEKELIVALFPQQIKAYLSRGKQVESLAKAPEVASLLTAADGPVMLSYCDTRRVFDLVYPFVPMIAQVVTAQLQREGIDVSVSLLPSASAIGKHLRPGVGLLKRSPAGIEIVSRQTLPGGNIGASAPVAVALLLPAVRSARGAARRSQSANNLKQIGLAMHNSMSAHKTFPPAYTADKEGKPLLSWRVAILPYLEHSNLYQQFHLDEPWDSEHNKKLIAAMPSVYRSASSAAPPDRTVYLTVRGEKTAFPGQKAIGPADIRDGFSNTIMAVEASDAKAVVWTKPDDFDYSEDDPRAGLFGIRPGGCNVLICDGSVRFISAGIDQQALKAMFTRNGGEPIEDVPYGPGPVRPPRRTGETIRESTPATKVPARQR